MHDDRFEDARLEVEYSPVHQLPRITGDEVDDARLIAKLHAAIARETGHFGLPWYRKGWVQGAAATCVLLIALLIGFSVGQRAPREVVPEDPESQNFIANQDARFANDQNKGAWLTAIDEAVNQLGAADARNDSTGMLANDPAWRSTMNDQVMYREM